MGNLQVRQFRSKDSSENNWQRKNLGGAENTIIGVFDKQKMGTQVLWKECGFQKAHSPLHSHNQSQLEH